MAGATFAKPARVSEDGWAINGCPDDGPALAADPAGGVHIVWPTVIPGDEPQGALFYAPMQASGGFAGRVRIPTLGSPKPSHPQVAVDGTGRLFVAWDESIEGVRRAAFSVAERDGAVVRFGAPTRLASDGPTLYPVMAPLAQGVVVAWTEGPPAASTIRVKRLVAPAAATAPPTVMSPAGTAHDLMHAGTPGSGPQASGQQQPPPAKPDHMQHRFDDPERFAKSFDDPARDAWQMPDRVIDHAGPDARTASSPTSAPAPVTSASAWRRSAGRHGVRRRHRARMVDTSANARRRGPDQRRRRCTRRRDAPNLPKPVDVVLIVDTYHHLPQPIHVLR